MTDFFRKSYENLKEALEIEILLEKRGTKHAQKNDKKNDKKNDNKNEFAEIDKTIAYFKNQAEKKNKKRNFTLAFGETQDPAPIYVYPKWHDKIYPSEESVYQSSNEDEQELHLPFKKL